MSLAIVHSRAQVGVEAPAVTVEAHLANGLPALTLVGLPEGAVKESKDRVRSAILNSGLDFPPRRITLNLGPAYLPGMADGSILLLRWVCWPAIKAFRKVALEPDAIARALVYAIEQPGWGRCEPDCGVAYGECLLGGRPD